MDVVVETASGLERSVKIAVPAGEVDSAVEKKLQETAAKVRINGFRPGKVPVREVRRRYGDSVRQEVLPEVVEKNFYRAMVQENIKPAGMPQIEFVQNQSGLDFIFTAKLEVFPHIALTGLDDLKVNKPVTEIAEQDIDTMAEKIRDQAATWEDKDGPAESGDQVVIDFEGTIDGEVFEGGTGEKMPVVLGSKQLIDTFEDQMLGLSQGEEKNIHVTFPEDYQNESLKGKPAEFSIRVIKVQTKKLPDMSEEFIKSFSIESGLLEDFRAEIKKNMARELNKKLQNGLRDQIVEQILEKNPLEVPKTLVEQEIKNQRQQALQSFGPEAVKNLPKELIEQLLPAEAFKEKAEKAVKVGLLFAEYINQHSIKADQDSVRAKLTEITASYQEPEQLIQWYLSNKKELAKVESLVVEDKVMEALLASAEVAEKPMSYQEVMEASAF